MRRLQLGTSLEGPSQLTPTSPCHGHLLPEEEEEEEDEDLGNGEEESCKSPTLTASRSHNCCEQEMNKTICFEREKNLK